MLKQDLKNAAFFSTWFWVCERRDRKSDTESGSYDLECSMGGAIAVRVAAKRALPTLAGLVVVDVVEVRCIHSREMSSLQLTICSE
jgi:hypothetical protein